MNPTFSNKLRCPRCRRNSIYQCSKCGRDVSVRKIKCDKCILKEGRWKKYYSYHPVIKNSAKITKLLKNKNYLSIDEISKELQLSNGVVRTTVYNMRKSGKEIITVKNRYILK